MRARALAPPIAFGNAPPGRGTGLAVARTVAPAALLIGVSRVRAVAPARPSHRGVAPPPAPPVASLLPQRLKPCARVNFALRALAPFRLLWWSRLLRCSRVGRRRSRGVQPALPPPLHFRASQPAGLPVAPFHRSLLRFGGRVARFGGLLLRLRPPSLFTASGGANKRKAVPSFRLRYCVGGVGCQVSRFFCKNGAKPRT